MQVFIVVVTNVRKVFKNKMRIKLFKNKLESFGLENFIIEIKKERKEGRKKIAY